MEEQSKMMILGEICTKELQKISSKDPKTTIDKMHQPLIQQENTIQNNGWQTSTLTDPLEENLLPIRPTSTIRIIRTKTIIVNKCKCKNMDVKQNSELFMTAQKIEDQTSIDVKNKSTTNAEIIQVEDNEVTQQKSINLNCNPTHVVNVSNNETEQTETFFKNISSYAECSKRATKLQANIFNFGHLQIDITQTEYLVKKNYVWNIIRNKGIMKIVANYPTQTEHHPTTLRTTLVRKNTTHRHHTIDKICNKHKIESKPEIVKHMMQTNNEPYTYWYDTMGTRRSICFYMNPEPPTVMNLKFLCNATCNTAGYMYRYSTIGQDLLLVITMERNGLIISRKTLEVCPKQHF